MFSADGRGVYVTTDKDSEFQRLGYIDLATKQLTPLATDLKWDVEDFDLSQDGKTLAFVGERRRRVEAVPVRHGDAPRCGRSPACRNGVRRRAGVASQQPRPRLLDRQRPLDRRRLLARRDDRHGQRWTESEIGGLVAAELSEPELIRWKSFDGREISGFLYRRRRGSPASGR